MNEWYSTGQLAMTVVAVEEARASRMRDSHVKEHHNLYQAILPVLRAILSFVF